MTLISTYSSLMTDPLPITWDVGKQPQLDAYTYSFISQVFDNTGAADQSQLSGPRGLIRLSFNARQNSSENPPTRIGIALHALPDGATPPDPPGTQAIRPSSNGTTVIEKLVPNGGYTVVDFSSLRGDDPQIGLHLAPMQYVLQLWNGSQYKWSEAPTVTLYRWNTVTS